MRSLALMLIAGCAVEPAPPEPTAVSAPFEVDLIDDVDARAPADDAADVQGDRRGLRVRFDHIEGQRFGAGELIPTGILVTAETPTTVRVVTLDMRYVGPIGGRPARSAGQSELPDGAISQDVWADVGPTGQWLPLDPPGFLVPPDEGSAVCQLVVEIDAGDGTPIEFLSPPFEVEVGL